MTDLFLNDDEVIAVRKVVNSTSTPTVRYGDTLKFAAAIQSEVEKKVTSSIREKSDRISELEQTIFNILEGCTLPHYVRKELEKVYYK